MLVTIGAYEYTIQYHPRSKMCNDDAPSRPPLPDGPSDAQIPSPGDVDFLLNHLYESIVTASQISVWTEKDPILSRVHHFVSCLCVVFVSSCMAIIHFRL